MRTENGQQESKATTRRGRAEGRKQPATKKPTPKAPRPTNSAATNRTRRGVKNGVSAQTHEQPAQRTLEAEEMVDRIGAQIGRFATLVGHEILRAAARAREEIEDMVAEAQSIRDTIQGDDL